MKKRTFAILSVFLLLLSAVFFTYIIFAIFTEINYHFYNIISLIPLFLCNIIPFILFLNFIGLFLLSTKDKEKRIKIVSYSIIAISILSLILQFVFIGSDYHWVFIINRFSSLFPLDILLYDVIFLSLGVLGLTYKDLIVKYSFIKGGKTDE